MEGGRRPKIVSMCAGIGGFDAGVFGEVVAYSETDDQAAGFLALRSPGAAQLGDMTGLATLDEWAPDVVTGGLPCQPVSSAGKRLGGDDERWLFGHLADLLSRGTGRPVLLLENTEAIVTVGVRELGQFFGSINALGYQVRTVFNTASMVGAPHRRRRWWCLAWCRDSDLEDVAAVLGTRFAPLPPRQHAPLLPTPLASDGVRLRGQSCHLTLGDALLPTPIAHDAVGRGWPGSLHYDLLPLVAKPDDPRRCITVDGHIARDGWGKYQRAIDHWTDIMGAPPPERIASLPGERYLLNAELSEWMMGFPRGWVTGQTDNETALRLIGNACCPPQAALAVESLRHPVQEALFDGEGAARSTISVAGAA